MTNATKRIENKQEEIRKARFSLSLYEEEQQGKAASPNAIERWDAENMLEDIRKMKENIARLEQELETLKTQPEEAESEETGNTYFEDLYNICTAYEEAKAERKKERDAMIEADDWDGVRAFDEREEKEFPRPYTDGQSKAYRAYRENLNAGSDGFFEVKCLPWEREMPDFLDSLRKAGINTILITDDSTSLLSDLFSLTALGCHMGSLKTYKRMEHRFGKDMETEVKGIEMEIA